MRDERERLQDILQAIERIDRYASRGRQAFNEDELIQTWFTQNLQVIGEAARALSPATRAAHPEVSWSSIIGMRNILTHNYFEIDSEIVWSVVQSELPDLKTKVEIMLQNL